MAGGPWQVGSPWQLGGRVQVGSHHAVAHVQVAWRHGPCPCRLLPPWGAAACQGCQACGSQVAASAWQAEVTYRQAGAHLCQAHRCSQVGLCC